MPKEVQFRLTDEDPNVTDDSTFGAAIWGDTWKFQCPQHMSILLKDGDMFSAYLVDASDAEFVDPDIQVKIEYRDPSGQRVELVYGPGSYLAVSEFQNKALIARLRLDHPILVKPRELIVVATKETSGLDSASIATSYFRLLTTKVIHD